VPVDVLAFGPHPDDIEIGLGASIAKHVGLGHTVGLCDLTRGELGSNGTVEERAREADAAAAVLGVAWRENLEWPDGGITSSPEIITSAVAFLRRHQPRVIAVPYWQDRHPDHIAASEALTLAAFRSGLRRFAPGSAEWRPDWICYYFINFSDRPSFVVDVSAHYAQKNAALDCYASQFRPTGADAAATRLTAPSFRQLIESRDAQFGAQVGAAFAEGIVVRDTLTRPSLLKF
jgi:bacillithiol biosynthesis deacetylase BshB1